MTKQSRVQSKMLRDHGQAKKYYHDIEGYNGRLDSIQAGILGVKLQHLAKWNESRRVHARKYDELFAAAETNIVPPIESSRSKSVYHLYVIQVDNREALQSDLANDNIDTGIHYPVPLHLQKAYAGMGYKLGDFPVCEKAAERIVSLPMFPGLTASDQERVVKAVVKSAQRTAPQNVVTAQK